MRKIILNEQTIYNIKCYIQQGHTLMETCNKFTLKPDTLKRIMREHNIEPFFKQPNVSKRPITTEMIQGTCNLFLNTNTTLRDIAKTFKLEYWELQEILNSNFTEEEQKNRKRKLYSLSKSGNKNPMKGKVGTEHPNYKGVIDDGNGYLMCLKPNWYTGRINSNYVFVHTVVMCEALSITELPKGFVIHHINGDKKDNNISNLALLTIGAHSKLHQLQNNMCKVQRLFKYEVGSNDNFDSETPDDTCK